MSDCPEKWIGSRFASLMQKVRKMTKVNEENKEKELEAFDPNMPEVNPEFTTEEPVNSGTDNSRLSSEEKLRAEVNEANDKFIRLYSEFENYKRRTSKERIDLIKTAGQDVILSLLPVVDDFERGLNAMKTAQDIVSVKDGVELVSQKMKKILYQNGLVEMECLGKDYDSDIHEAIAKIPSPNEELKGKIIDVVEKGYLMGDKVIRIAKVIIGE